MAYITQYQADMAQDQKNSKLYSDIGDSVSSIFTTIGENRRRAIDAKRQQDTQDMAFAKDGINSDAITEYRKSGDSSGIQKLYATLAETKRVSDAESERVDRDYKNFVMGKKLRAEDEPKLTFEEKEAIKSKYRKDGQEAKQPAQNEFAAAGYAKRARQAESELAGIPQETGTSYINILTDMLPNAAQRPAVQQYKQIKDNFITAVLRKESGASISDPEYSREEKKYFPQPGDSDAVIEQKKRAREQAMLNLEAEGARALPRVGSAQAPQDEVMSQVKAMSREEKIRMLSGQ